MPERPLALQRDPYAEKLLSNRFDWRDKEVLKWIHNFILFGERDSKANVKRLSAATAARYNKDGKKKKYRSTGYLLRSIAWKTWSEAGGDVQIFHAHYAYYEKFLELALGKNDPFRELPPMIPKPKWMPIKMPDRTRRARPAVPTEMRREARRFVTFIQDHFSFAGIAMMIFAASADNEHAEQLNRALFSRGLNGRGRFN